MTTCTYLATLLVHIVLPAGLLLSIAIRPFGLSIIYLLLYLIVPLIPVPDARTAKGRSTKFLCLIVVISIVLLIVHAIWHSVLAAFVPYGSLLDDYPIIQTIGHNLGLVSYVGIDILTAVHYVAPELVMTGTSLGVYILVGKLVKVPVTDDAKAKDSKTQQFPLLTSAGKYLCLIFIMFSGIMRPSVTSGLYFLVFMGAATAWSVGRPLERGYAVVGRCLMAVMAAHVTVLLVYQCTWLVDLYPPEMNLARYFGLTKLVNLNETDPSTFTYEVTDNHKWATLASPIIILFTYFILALETRELFKPKPKRKSHLTGVEAGKLNGSLVPGVSFRKSGIAAREKWMSATKRVRVAFPYINSQTLRGSPRENTPLIRNVSPSRRWSSVRSRANMKRPHLDSTGSVVLPPDEESMMEPEEPTLTDDIIAAIVDFFQVMVRSSYVATTITMMAWSIMFHSWLAFVFLMWANIVWLCADQRSFMLKTSPLLVVYAMVLLLAQYIYGMDLTEAELPSSIADMNLQQIGLGRSEGEPCVPLLIKSLFTCMFWVTLRQLVQETRQRRRSAAITDMAAPLQLTVSTAASVIEAHREDEARSRLLRIVGDFLRAACARYWIYVVVIMMFVIGITGTRMTIFRIVYMFLFLGFILMFQISWYWWRRLMYVFWITLIIYSMIDLNLIYVYQFDDFSGMIAKYLGINERLQHDLGLEPYKKADLFVKLLTPTCFLIITIVQVHYFHKDFMALSDPRSRPSSMRVSTTSRRASQTGASTTKDEAPALTSDGVHRSPDHSTSESLDLSTYKSRKESQGKPSRSRSYAPTTEPASTVFKTWLLEKFIAFKSHFYEWVDHIFLYLHLHLLKIIFVALAVLCVTEVCAMHVPIMIIIAPGLLFNTWNQRVIVLLISTLISIYFMLKMIYQIDYVPQSYFDVNCTTDDVNGTIEKYNNALWFGFTKTTHNKSLASVLKGYIGLIAMFTFHSLVMYRQQTIRDQASRAMDKVMYPEVTRKEADINMCYCTKYIINYGFYKFGVEVTLICLIGVIGSRMDVYSVLYACWLMLLVSVKRATQARLWPAFTLCVTVLVPVQYMVAVGVMPQFCIDYVWSGDNSFLKHLRTWFFLPYAKEPPHATKLVFDFVLLLFASRQLRVFGIERTQGDDYAGGSNSEDIGQDWETPEFVNPVPDFLGVIGTWLDVLKRMVFLGMLWVTLAIMFLTGTNRVNLFSMGYLIGSFIFLWQGTDFYLRPKKSILQWWSWLLSYNVTVVVVKTLLQIPGCLYGPEMRKHACWLVQLLGIGCVDKFAGGNIARFIKMSNVDKDGACTVPQEDIGLAWDGVCFAFLILQRRLFHSYYFYRVIDESKATTVLASRGAELIEELRQKQMNLQEEQEVRILEKIKVKMERIKANQKKIQGTMTKEAPHHDHVNSLFRELTREEEEEEESGAEQVPLVRGDSESRGYHTPDSPASPRGFHTPLSEQSAPPSRAPSPPAPAPLPAPPSPCSALMTVSLDAYLEPRRISFESPPSSELVPRAQSPEESYPVFSPPPIRRRHTVASPSLLQRTSIISMSSRAEPNSHHTLPERPYRQPASHQKAVRSGDYYMFDEFDDTEVPLKEDESSSDEDAPKEMSLGKLLSTAIKTDLKRAVSLRRASMPAVRPRPNLSIGTYPYSDQQEVPRQQDVNLQTERDGVSDLDEIAPIPETWLDKIYGYWLTAWAFINSFLVTVTKQLMKFSRDYRYVSRALSTEKKILKETEGFGIGRRDGSQMIWEPLPESLQRPRKLSDISVPEIRILAPSMERGLDATPPSRRSTPPSRRSPADDDDTSEHESAFSLQSTESKDLTILEEQEDSMFRHGRSPFVHLVVAMWYMIVAHTDIVCYIMVFINQIQSATILSIPLPMMVFLWGTLTIPRPTKTFWVTLIAYTEVIVLLKSMFQFEILPWNQIVIPDNMPFTAPRIIGIERKSNYALYDLLLLLIIFLHRFMLKSLGLWKESNPEVDLRKDMEFPVTAEDTAMIVEGKGVEVGQKYVKLHDKIGPRHWLVDWLRAAQPALAAAARELGLPRTHPLVEELAWQLVQKHPKSTAKYRLKRNLWVTPDNQGPLGSPIREDGEAPEQARDDAEPEPGPSRAPDDDHYKVNDDQEPIIAITTSLEDKYQNIPKILALSVKRYLRPTKRFFERMLAPGARVTADVYAYMFLCDFLNFLVVIFGFAAFGTQQGDGGVKAYLEENKVPVPFLVMLILQFALIVIDRALYLRKFMLGKILFQYALVIGVHIWMFFVLPFITERTFNARFPPPLWYMVKCVYLLLSAHQIRCGYPRRIIGNFLCKSYRFLNMLFFRCFMAVPFVFELRTLMDWIWTDTSMTLMDWLKMEDIFASVFLLKCSRYMEDEYPQPRGLKKSNVAKYVLGGSVLAFVIAIIWFPLVFFAFGNSVGEPNPPTDVTVKIRIGPFLPVYQMSAQSHNIDLFTEQDFTQLSNQYSRDRTAQTFLSNYIYNDVAVVMINPNSTLKWEISPPELARLEREALSNNSLTVKFSFVITHPSNNAQNPPTIDDNREVVLPAYVGGKRNQERVVLQHLLTGNATSDTWLNVRTLFPKFLKVFNKGTAKPAFQLTPETGDMESRQYRDVQLRLERESDVMYWRVREACNEQDSLLLTIPKNNCDMLVMYTFNDKLFPETLNFISGGGIIGLYTTFVFLASRVLRGFFSGIYTKIMFDDLPNVDRVLQLCLDIYLVREALEMALEEDLFAKLVFLYRSPETMIKWTRPKDEDADEQRALPPLR